MSKGGRDFTPQSNPLVTGGSLRGGWRSLVGGKYEFTASSPDVSDAAIDKIIKSGRDPGRVLRGKMGKMAPDQRRKVERRIGARRTKASQGK